MTYIRLTNDCQFFDASRVDDAIVLVWNMSLNLMNYQKIALREIQIGPLLGKRHDYLVKVHSNIIPRTLYNPLRELATVRCSRNSSFIDGVITKG